MNFISVENIERIASRDFSDYLKKVGIKSPQFPLDPEEIFRILFGLNTRYIDFEEHNISSKSEGKLLGALYPEGFEFCGEDKQILVNVTNKDLEDQELFAYIEQAQRFTVFHEGGHEALHVRPSRQQTSLFPADKKLYNRGQPFLCRSDQILGETFDPLEFQANRYAAALMMPRDEIFRIVEQSNIVDLHKFGAKFRKYFGVSQKAMEVRLNNLKYVVLNGKYSELFYRKEPYGNRK